VRHKRTTRQNPTLQRASIPELAPNVRSGLIHRAMDHAESTSDHDLWNEIGEVIIEMYESDDLSTQLSDHFVNHCPIEVFIRFAARGPIRKFRAWAKRSREAGVL
jgi:hypothetical protein